MINRHSSQNIEHLRRPGIRPTLNKLQKIDSWVRSFVPWTVTLFIILFLSIPMPIPGRNELLPAIVCSSVYFWSIFRPKSMPAIGVFMLGLMIDLLNFSSPGIIIFMVLIIYGIAVTQRFRLAKYNFLWVWSYFSLISILLFTLQWMVVSLLSVRLMSYQSNLFEIIFAIGFYPLLSIFFTWAHRTIANPEQV